MPTDANGNVRPENDVSNRALYCSEAFIERLFARKPMTQLHAEIEIQNGLRRTLNWFQLTAIGLGAMIGE
jgi:hypothetical protein